MKENETIREIDQISSKLWQIHNKLTINNKLGKKGADELTKNEYLISEITSITSYLLDILSKAIMPPFEFKKEESGE